MNSDTWGPLIVSLCGALVAAVAFTVLGTTGWREFARAYPDRPFQTQITYQGFRGYVGQAPFWSGGPVLVAVGEDGLRLVPLSPVRQLLPVVAVPWSAITTFQSVRPLFARNFIRLGVAGAMFPLCISGFLERQSGIISRLREYWEARGPYASSNPKPLE